MDELLENIGAVAGLRLHWRQQPSPAAATASPAPASASAPAPASCPAFPAALLRRVSGLWLNPGRPPHPQHVIDSIVTIVVGIRHRRARSNALHIGCLVTRGPTAAKLHSGSLQKTRGRASETLPLVNR